MPCVLETCVGDTAQAQAQASGVFDLGVEQNTVALTMQRLRRQAVHITRPKVNFMLLAKMKMMGSSIKKKVRGMHSNTSSAPDLPSALFKAFNRDLKRCVYPEAAILQCCVHMSALCIRLPLFPLDTSNGLPKNLYNIVT